MADVPYTSELAAREMLWIDSLGETNGAILKLYRPGMASILSKPDGVLATFPTTSPTKVNWLTARSQGGPDQLLCL
jgi:hypothetical protein